ncbi:MAG: clpP 3 [Eubacterium sp.]|nr:clpP 3 [Eubacterium sp.]
MEAVPNLLNKKYWEFKNQTSTEADLYLYIEIAWWGAGYAAHSAQSFKAELDALGEIQILNIYINSPGGDVFEALAIHNMLKRKKYIKNVYVDGLAASAASVVAMAGDKIIMPSNTMMMIHNPWTSGEGFAKDFRDIADRLDKAAESVRQTYLEKTNGKIEETELIKLLDAESWLTAQECFDYGLCDEVATSKQVAAKYTGELFGRYKNIPDKLVQMKQADSEKLNKLKITVIDGLSKGE